MRVAFVCELGDWSASTRFRALQYASRVAKLVGNVDVLLPDDRPNREPGRLGQARYFASHGERYLRRCRYLSRHLDDYDAILVQRGLYGLGPGLVARPLDRFAGRVVFDLDDAVFSASPSLAKKSKPARWLYGPQQAERVLKRADAVVVSTPELAKALPFQSADAVILPTVPDPASYDVAAHRPGLATIGWAGTNGGLGYLDPLKPIFARLRENGTRVEVVSSVAWNGPADFRPWRRDDEPHLFARFSVGIMPLPDTAYTRAKAGFKLLQYMAAGVPVVASPIGVNAELIARSGGGFLADSPGEWESALETLVADHTLRQRMGSAGKDFVARYADLDGHAATLATLLKG
jgi:hypothetical protein